MWEFIVPDPRTQPAPSLSSAQQARGRLGLTGTSMRASAGPEA